MRTDATGSALSSLVALPNQLLAHEPCAEYYAEIKRQPLRSKGHLVLRWQSSSLRRSEHGHSVEIRRVAKADPNSYSIDAAIGKPCSMRPTLTGSPCGKTAQNESVRKRITGNEWTTETRLRSNCHWRCCEWSDWLFWLRLWFSLLLWSYWQCTGCDKEPSSKG